MNKFFLLSFGAMFGAATTYFFTNAFEKLDEGISQTYRCDQLAREDDAKRSAEKIIEHFLGGRSSSDLEVIIKATGLQIEHFDKGGHTEFVVGHSPKTRALRFLATVGGNVSILPIPGSEPCHTIESDRSQ